jgi:hypothetical protein
MFLAFFCRFLPSGKTGFAVLSAKLNVGLFIASYSLKKTCAFYGRWALPARALGAFFYKVYRRYTIKILNKDSIKKRAFGIFAKKGVSTLGILAALAGPLLVATSCDSNVVHEETRPDKLTDPLPKVFFPDLTDAAEWSQVKADAEMLKVVEQVCNSGETLMWQYKNYQKAGGLASDTYHMIKALETLLTDCRQNNGKLLFNRKIFFPPLNSLLNSLTRLIRVNDETVRPQDIGNTF